MNQTKYELMVAFIPSLTEKEVEKELENIKSIVSQNGEVPYIQVWGKRDLYYKINGHEKGIYAVLHFLTDTSLKSINRELGLLPHLMRFVIVALPKNYEVKPFIMIEEEEKPKKEEKKEFVKKTAVKPVKKAIAPKTKKEKTVEVVEEEVAPEKEPVVEVKAESAKESSKKKKSSFDEKIDEIIENLDNL